MPLASSVVASCGHPLSRRPQDTPIFILPRQQAVCPGRGAINPSLALRPYHGLAAMLFPSPVFLLGFLPLTLAGYFAVGRILPHRYALAWLICASLVFYGWWNPWYLPLLLGSVLANHTLAGRMRASAQPRRWLVAGLTLNLGLLGWFKYADCLRH